MTSAFERRVQRALASTQEAMTGSKWVIWCLELEKMPAMIDLLIAQGRLSESDRPHCMHWSELKGPREFTDEDSVKLVDAEEMLAAAGIRTLMADGWDAWVQGMEALEALVHDRFGSGLDPDERAEIDKLESKARLHRIPPA
jgi:hypothetical protein